VGEEVMRDGGLVEGEPQIHVTRIGVELFVIEQNKELGRRVDEGCGRE
jgi:hypothetical protein